MVTLKITVEPEDPRDPDGKLTSWLLDFLGEVERVVDDDPLFVEITKGEQTFCFCIEWEWMPDLADLFEGLKLIREGWAKAKGTGLVEGDH